MGYSIYIEKIKQRLEKKKRVILKKGISEGKNYSLLIKNDLAKYFNDIIYRMNDKKIEILKDISLSMIEKTIVNNEKVIILMIKNILKKIPYSNNISIILNPNDAQIFRLCSLEYNMPDIKIVIIEDDNLVRGSIIITANKITINADINTQIKKAIELISLELHNGLTY